MTIPKKIDLKENQKDLVFLHYFGGSNKSWKWVIDELKDGYRCVAINLPGFGNSVPLEEPSIESLAEYIQKEMELLEFTNYVIVAHSMSAKIAIQIAANVPKEIAQLILICPSPPGIEPIEDDEKARMLKHPNLEEALTTVKNITKIPLSEAQHTLAVENNLVVDDRTWSWWLNDGMNHSVEDLTKGLKMPIAILNSNNDPVITPEIIKERVLNIFPKAKLFTTEHSGHLIPMENSRWVAEQIRNTLATNLS